MNYQALNKAGALLLLLMLFGIKGIFAQPKSFSLEEAKSWARDNNIQNKNANLEYLWAKKRAAEIIATGLPQVSGELAYQNNFQLPITVIPNSAFLGGFPEPVRQMMGITDEDLQGNAETAFGTRHNARLGVSLYQLIADGRYFIGLQANKTLIQIYTDLREQNRKEVNFKVEQAYYAALVASETETILSGNLKTLEKTLNDTREMFRAGLVEDLDVDRLELSLNNFKVQLQQAKNQNQLALLNLKFQMGYPLKDSIVLSQTIADFAGGDQPEAELVFDFRTRIEYKALQGQMMMREFDRKQTLAGYMPALNFFARYETNALRNEFDFFDTKQRWFPSGNFGISLSMNLFDSFTKRYIGQQKEIQRDQMRNQLANMESAFNMEVEQAQRNYINAWNEYKNQEKNLQLAEKIYSKSKIKYDNGVGSSLEVTNAESTLVTTQANYINSLYQVLLAKVSLKQAKGID